MRSSREKLVVREASSSAYEGSEGDSPEARLEPQGWGGASQTRGAWEHAWAADRRASRDSEPPAGGSCWGGSGGGSGALEEWEQEVELGMMSPESQKRERRRIANRDCARRIRQRKTVRGSRGQ